MSDGAARSRWVIAGGGTGGHVTPALALAERIAASGASVLFIGSEHGLETRLVPEAGIELAALPSQQVMGRGVAGRLAAGLAMLRACATAWRRLGSFDANLVISVGGYASVPAVAAAWLRRIPVVLVEPNAVPGRANRAAARIARRVFVQFEAAAARLVGAGHRERVRNSGIPLRVRLIEAFRAQPPRRAATAPFHLLVFGGSQGARQINEAMMEAAPSLAGPEAEITIFHQTGEADRDRVAEAYATAGVAAEVVDFERDMPSRYRWADLAVCRSGALTVAELALAGLPAIFVPYPFAADDHQAANARALADAGAARVLDSHTLSAEKLADSVRELFGRPERLRSMSAAAEKLARPNAAEEIIAECAGLTAHAGSR
jgi:UDP-N-acetylglucosamine--N-acetylmuramyl-(pentapeptide) pyrophosphoryl-undecaprenol N-acetylglucosamine transferase